MKSTQNTPPRFTSRRIHKAALSLLGMGLLVSVTACAEADTIVPGEGQNVETGTTSIPENTDGAATPVETGDAGSALAKADVIDVNGKSMAQVMFSQQDGAVQLSVTADGMDPGFYGLHIHEIGECEPESAAPDDASDTGAFKSAGGHIAGENGAKHPSHAGDLPTLLVKQDGTAIMEVNTDRLDESLLLDDDGAAVMLHSKPDNFANIPQRYSAEGPDQDTTSAGDAGERLACGVVES